MRLLGKAINRVRYWFARHEMWVLETARDVPILSMIAIGTLFIWFFIPAIFLAPFVALAFENESSIGIFAMAAIGAPLLVAGFIWLFEWYLIGVTLIFGGQSMADKKAKDLELQLTFLERNRERLQ